MKHSSLRIITCFCSLMELVNPSMIRPRSLIVLFSSRISLWDLALSVDYRNQKKYGKIDVAVSNAAANPTIATIVKTKESALDKLWVINVKAYILIAQGGKYVAEPHVFRSLLGHRTTPRRRKM